MRVVIVYESLFGNTHEIAEAVRTGIARAQEEAQVICVPVAGADPELVRSADLLVVGGPTHMRGMSTGLSRRLGVEGEQKAAAGNGEVPRTEPGAAGPGVRDWLHALPKAPKGGLATAFDTRADFRMAGGAARGIVHRLTHHGYELVAEPEGFLIEDTEGPLREGERDRAEEWGAALAWKATAAAGSRSRR